MGERTGVSWTHHTWNPWRGCTMVSPGCVNCYMFEAQRKYGNDPETVVRTKTWGDPIKWQRAAAAGDRHELVFTCSWSDWFHSDADPWRDEAWEVIRSTPNLTYQILTKRHYRMAECLPRDWGRGYPNVWLGVTVENVSTRSRLEALRAVPAAVKFVSFEPLLEPIRQVDLAGIDWAIIGAESGPNFRSIDVSEIAYLAGLCDGKGVRTFVKQDCGPRSGLQGRIDDAIWKLKEFPATWDAHLVVGS